MPCERSTCLESTGCSRKEAEGHQTCYHPPRSCYNDILDIGCTPHDKLHTQYAELADIHYKGIILTMYKHASDLQSVNPTPYLQTPGALPKPTSPPHHHTPLLTPHYSSSSHSPPAPPFPPTFPSLSTSSTVAAKSFLGLWSLHLTLTVVVFPPSEMTMAVSFSPLMQPVSRPLLYFERDSPRCESWP